MSKVKLVTIDTNRPVLIEFQNGKIEPGEEKSLQSAVFKDTRTNQKIIGVTNGDMVYSCETLNNNNDLFNNFLVVHNKAAKKIELIQVDTATVAPLLDRKVSAFASPVDKPSAAELRKKFGSKKSKRYAEQQERLTMNIENIKEDLEKTVADINVSEITTTLPDESETLYRPRINRDASCKEQVYQITDLVPVDVLDSLEQRVSEILEAEDLKEYGLTSTIENNILALKASSIPEKAVVEKCKILLYIHYLIHFMNTPLKNMTRNFEACDCSQEVDKHIKQTYMVNRTRPLCMKDKGLCFIIVLLMLAMDFEISLETVSKDLRTGLKKMQELAKNLGFSQSPNSKSSIMLKIPVPPPVAPSSKRKRR